MSRQNIYIVLGSLLLVLMLVFEARYYVPKIIILFILLFMNLGRIKISRQVIRIYLPLCFSTLIGVVGGMIRGHEHCFYGITTGIIWPFVSLLIAIPLLMKEKSYFYLMKMLFFIHSFLIIYDLVFSLSIIYDYPFINIYPEIEIPFSFYGTTSRMNFGNLNVLTFTIPVFLMVWLTRYDIGITRTIQTLVLLTSFFLLILSGRRSLMMIFPIAPFVVIMMGRNLPLQTMKRVVKYLTIFVSVLILFVVYFYITNSDVFEGYLLTFTKAFDSDEEPVKFMQAKQLFDLFIENPLFGAGTGFKLYESYRGIWKTQFELTYFYILASRGMIGFILYLLGVAGPLWLGLKYARRNNDNLFIFLLIGYLFVIIADATNPVLCSFDLMLPLYLCYARINYLYFYSKKRIFNGTL